MELTFRTHYILLKVLMVFRRRVLWLRKMIKMPLLLIYMSLWLVERTWSKSSSNLLSSEPSKNSRLTSESNSISIKKISLLRLSTMMVVSWSFLLKIGSNYSNFNKLMWLLKGSVLRFNCLRWKNQASMKTMTSRSLCYRRISLKMCTRMQSRESKLNSI